jgi:hypothetical protein
MTKITEIHFHPSFEFGKTDEPNVTDWPLMTEGEQNRLANWMADILGGESVIGLNKPSWTNNGQVMKHAKVYQDNNVWHYHCGPSYVPSPAGYIMTDCMLSQNLRGKASPEIYHYAKQQELLIVLGFSRQHIPFPDPMSRSNPLRYRSSTWKRAIPAQK